MDERYEDGFDAGYEQGRKDAIRMVSMAFVSRVKGGWPDDHLQPDTPKGWERWGLLLHGEEAEDTLEGAEGQAHFLKLFGDGDEVLP